jgi:enediyne polyketide synthase
MTPGVAIVGMACRYPDARSPVELWENVLAQRRAFRRMPPQRMRWEEYYAPSRDEPDHSYSLEAAVLEDYEFDRERFHVAGSTFRSADLAHWLALDVAAQALSDGGFPAGEGLPRETTGVLLGNTLTGEFSRANVLRLRWPYVRRVVEAALAKQGWSATQRGTFLERLEAQYKAPFPPVADETLAGGLSNTIAGRICNHFDLKGGGYTLDGACASSLLAVTAACSALAAGDLDVALAGGVDLSLDPFELVGFAKAGALAAEEMWVYDARAGGFWPGEGCGFVLLMRHDEAVGQHRRIWAVVRGWGVSSDGSGGITRPEVEGQLLALRRAYRRAGFGIDTVGYFEGHGTGTSVGDATELEALSRARREQAAHAPPAVIGSIKANIGHTKAAAGIAGLIKATMALNTQVVPPSTAWQDPHPLVSGEEAGIQLLRQGKAWPADRPLRAGVSAMGFGGINSHVVLEGVAATRRAALDSRERMLLGSAQDAELFLLSGRDRDALQRRAQHLLSYAAQASRAELADLAAQLAALPEEGPVRAALVACRPAELARGLERLDAWLADGVATRLDFTCGVFLGSRSEALRIGFVFPGQGSPTYSDGGAWRCRFDFVHQLYDRAALPTRRDGTATEVAQPTIVTASLAGLLVMDRLGINATVALGHSLGELTAFYWAGALDEPAVLRIATARGKAIAEFARSGGAMASIAAGRETVLQLADGEPVVIAGLNSPNQTVISGEASAVTAVVSRARARGLSATSLPVSHAFHSPLVSPAGPALAAHLRGETFGRLQLPVFSTVTGCRLAPQADLAALLLRQMSSPVRFMQAVRAAAHAVDLWIEVGPGHVLRAIVAELVDVPVVALDAGGPSLRELLEAVGVAYAMGAPVNQRALFAARFIRPFELDWRPRFLQNPCELAPIVAAAPRPRQFDTDDSDSLEPRAAVPAPSTSEAPIEILRRLIAQRTELPTAAVKDDSRLLRDLHLSSLAVGRLVAEAARCIGLPPPLAPSDYAGATVAQAAQALEELKRTGVAALAPEARVPPGVDSWIRSFSVELLERALRRRRQRGGGVGGHGWRVIAPADHPLRDVIGRALADTAEGGGVVLCLPPHPDERHVALLLDAARAVLDAGQASRFVLVQHSGGGAAFARTLHLETPDTTTCVVDVPYDHPRAAEWISAEASAAEGYSEAHYDACGRRREPVLRLLALPDQAGAPTLGPRDVLLITGGGKGIAAECGIALARETGVPLVLLGRSKPDADAELAANLDRIASSGVRCRYVEADVTDAAAVRAAIRVAETELGPVTAIVHGAGSNVPQLLRSLDEPAFLRTLAPKLQGARNVLAAVNPDRLRLFVTFGSIIARTGMRGEADYAVANEWLARLTERWQAEHPDCRCLAVEWSVWSGVGMGQRLGRVDALMQQGITPITTDEGVRWLSRLVRQRFPSVRVVVTGRFGEPPTLQLERPELPLLRFLERPRVYYPGVELVADVELTPDTDPYLKDHVFRGDKLFPAVIGLEAMAQAAMAVMGSSGPPTFEDVRFARAIAVPDGSAVTIRLAALVREPGRVEVVLRSAETAFHVDHFRASCRFESEESESPGPAMPRCDAAPCDAAHARAESPVPISLERDLYGSLLFQTGRFRRLRGYRLLRATECVAEISSEQRSDWFGRYLPRPLVLGDPAVRDAAMHAIQACIPHAVVLPVAVERLVPHATGASAPLWVHARERSRDGDRFVYDVSVSDSQEKVLESWDGLHLRIAERVSHHGPWSTPLLGPYLERRLSELAPGSSVAVAIERNGEADRRTGSEQAIWAAIGATVPVERRPDGRPEVIGRGCVSAAHAADFILAVAGSSPVACDVEPVQPRSVATWRDLLGPERLDLAELIGRTAREDRDAAATRVWAAIESLKKAGATADVPLVLASSSEDGWVLLRAGSGVIATFVAQVRDAETRLALAVLRRGEAWCNDPTNTDTWSRSKTRTWSATSTT